MQSELVTIESPRGGHRTFRIARRKEAAKWAPGEMAVSLLAGPENEADYCYETFGFVRDDGSVSVFRRLRGSPGAPSAWEVYADMLRHRGHYSGRGYTYHAARLCDRCGRLLTTPESIEAGIGPECAARRAARGA